MEGVGLRRGRPPVPNSGTFLKTFTFPEREKETFDKFVEIVSRERVTMSSLIQEMIRNYVKEHGDTHNPQSTITDFKGDVMALPSLMAPIEVWKKFYSICDVQFYKKLDPHWREKINLHNKVYDKIMERQK